MYHSKTNYLAVVFFISKGIFVCDVELAKKYKVCFIEKILKKMLRDGYISNFKSFEELAMGSFAVFTDKNAANISIEVHFNLWNRGYTDNDLDIGIKLRELNESQAIYVWLPFKIQRQHFKSLKPSLEDIDVINAIFNENYVMQREGQSKWIYLKRKQNANWEFKIYLLEIQDVVLVSPKELGFKANDSVSIIKININPEKPYKIPIYLRFRVQLPESTEIIHEYNKPHHWIRGAFSKNYVIDFRYNDKRSFSTSENETINTKYCLSETTKLHFLLMAKVYVEVECSTDVRKRRLEPNIWNKYVSNGETTNIIAYHASQKTENGDIGSWEFFAKQTVEIEDWKLLAIFIVITLLISASGSILGNYLEKLICKFIEGILR